MLVSIVVMATALSFTGCEVKEAPQVPITQAGIYVYDDGDLLDEYQEAALNNVCLDLEDKTGAFVMVLTVDGLDGHTADAYAREVLKAIDVGQKNMDESVLLLVSRAEGTGDACIEVGEELEGIFDGAKRGRILEDCFEPHRVNDEYALAVGMTTHAIVGEIAAGKGAAIDGVDTAAPGKADAKDDKGWPWSAFILYW